MANYTIQASPAWNARDALAQGHADKVVSGQLFHDEFTAIADAIDDKAELTGSSTQQFEASTPNTGDDTNKVATTAYVQTEISGMDTKQNIIDAIYPVGSLYTTTISTNPAGALGGSWLAFGEGNVLVGKASSGTFSTAGATGGEETHQLTDAEMPSHNHAGPANANQPYGNNGITATRHTGGDSGNTQSLTSTVGSDEAHNNLQPYVVVYMWKRTG